MQQVAEPLHLAMDPFDNFLFVACAVEPLDKLLPVDQLVQTEVTDVQQQVNLFRSQCNVENPEGMLEFQISDDTLVASVGLLKCLLEGLGTRPQDILHGFHQFPALVFDVILILVVMLQIPSDGTLNYIEVLIDPVISRIVFI